MNEHSHERALASRRELGLIIELEAEQSLARLRRYTARPRIPAWYSLLLRVRVNDVLAGSA